MALSATEHEDLTRASQASAGSTAQYLSDTTNNAARIKALTAAKNLLFELQNGDDAFFYRLEQVAAATVLRFLINVKALEAMPQHHPISAADLATTLHCEPAFIIRLMRLCVAAGTFAEPTLDTYAHTKRSLSLLDPGYYHFFTIMMDDFYARGCFPALSEYFALRERKCPSDPKRNVYTYSQGMDGRDWHEVFARTPELLRRVNVAFSGRWASVPVLGAYPFEGLVDMGFEGGDGEEGRVLMVDVGGAVGGSMKELREAVPGLKGVIVLQDQESVIGSIPEGFLSGDVVPMVHDFFTPQPVKGAKVYYMRRVLHDWPDLQASQILQHQADAMAEDSIILIADMVVPEKVQRDDTYVYWMDLTMLMFAGKGRSAKDWQKLFDESGLELVKIWEPAIGTQCVVEGRKKK